MMITGTFKSCSMQCTNYRILVIDFGSQYTQLLLRRIRDLGVYSELFFWNVSLSQILEFNPNGIILSGGPNSAINKNAPHVPIGVFQLGIPILGICYGMQIMMMQLGGQVQSASMSVHGEFGYAQVEILSNNILIDNIYDYIDDNKCAILDVWMSHRDTVINLPQDFDILGITKYRQIAMIVNEKNHLYGLQFHPEVTHTKKGKNILERFVKNICGCKSVWAPSLIIDDIVTNIRSIVKNDRVVLAFSGGVDSFVTALLLERAIGNKFICIFINNGLLRTSKLNRFKEFYEKQYNLNIIYVSEESRFLNSLIGVVDPEEKRKIIGKVFIEVIEDQIFKLKNIKWLAQGTIYSDVIESGMSIPGTLKNVIKSHHNVGGIPNKMHFQLLEPIRNLFKDEVRNIGIDLGLTDDIVYSYPYPGPGLAIRIIGEVKKEYCDILRRADDIFFEELKRENLYTTINQAFSVFLPINSVGIQGDKRNYTWVIALRAIETVDFMTARWVYLPHDFLDKVSNRIVNEISGISRVVYDISSKPPATIEWE